MVIGVDLGGTNVRATAIDEQGREVGPRVQRPSQAKEGVSATIRAIAETVLEAAQGAEWPPQAVGLAIPGWVDDTGGMVRWSPNFGEFVDGVFRYWRDVLIKPLLVELIQLPVHMGNDANLAALGEYWYGSGKGEASSLVMFTVGTGIGSGVILRPASLHGNVQGTVMLVGGNQGGAELGHMIIQHNGLDCRAGTYGTVEAYCQIDSIVRRAQYRLQRGRHSIVRDLCGGDFGKLTPLELSVAADQGDELALQVYAEVGEMLGVAIANAINIFAPEIVAIGGQVSKAGRHLIEPAIRSARDCAIEALFADAQIVAAHQIDDAGILGAAALALGK